MFFEWFITVMLVCGEPQDMKLIHTRTGEEFNVSSMQDIAQVVPAGQLIKTIKINTNKWMICT